MARSEPRWVSRLLVEAIHFDQRQAHGGMRGLRDEGALDSALARPRNKRGYGRRVDLAALAAGRLTEAKGAAWFHAGMRLLPPQAA